MEEGKIWEVKNVYEQFGVCKTKINFNWKPKERIKSKKKRVKTSGTIMETPNYYVTLKWREEIRKSLWKWLKIALKTRTVSDDLNNNEIQIKKNVKWQKLVLNICLVMMIGVKKQKNKRGKNGIKGWRVWCYQLFQGVVDVEEKLNSGTIIFWLVKTITHWTI